MSSERKRPHQWAAYARGAVQQPCVKDCPDRKAGCAVTCGKWAEYVSTRNTYYERQKLEQIGMTENGAKRFNRNLARRKSKSRK